MVGALLLLLASVVVAIVVVAHGLAKNVMVRAGARLDVTYDF